ncbi:MAG: hypothetical protein ABIG63_01735 [Chloroflexota bacterium]
MINVETDRRLPTADGSGTLWAAQGAEQTKANQQKLRILVVTAFAMTNVEIGCDFCHCYSVIFRTYLYMIFILLHIYIL